MTDEEKVLHDKADSCKRRLRTLQDKMRVVFRELDKIETELDKKKYEPYKKVWVL